MTFPFIGLAVGGVKGAAIGMLIFSTPGPGTVLSVLVAAATVVPWLGECRCVPQTCQYNAAIDSCQLKVELGASNPYSWLPYPGTKCAEVEIDAGKPKECALTACF